MSFNSREFLKDMFDAALTKVKGAESLIKCLPEKPKGRTIVIGAGKAGGAMAKVVEDNWSGDLEGLVVTRYGHGVKTKRIEVVEASHPTPDEAGRNAAKRIYKMVQGLSKDDLVICLISGGGSALLSLPAPEIPLEDKQAMNKMLLKSGADIAEINSVRKHISAIKGGRLAKAAYPAKIVAMLISDVPGDDPSVIASGPTVADPTTFEDAREVIKKYGLNPPDSIKKYLEEAKEETPKAGSKYLENVTVHMLATPQDALDEAARFARSRGFETIILGNALEGEARDVAKVHAGIVKQIKGFSQPIKKPCVILSGGETTVTVKGNGKGGRNAEFSLALAMALKGMERLLVIPMELMVSKMRRVRLLPQIL
ncbi:MAG: putative hydroxypyruvate reductase [Alphaproteobacteria bacterium ADurb.Bin438]|nr:MAG: putative hydroxypyruvate reductase [Alphaproteobacteria bacterium ADurb.Bin438]